MKNRLIKLSEADASKSDIEKCLNLPTRIIKCSSTMTSIIIIRSRARLYSIKQTRKESFLKLSNYPNESLKHLSNLKNQRNGNDPASKATLQAEAVSADNEAKLC